MPILIGLGSPLLDISANVGSELLDKYGLKENGAVLIDQQNMDKFMPLEDEILNLDSVLFLPGGSALNTIRVFQWVSNGINGQKFHKADRAIFFGSVGNDSEAEMLIEKTLETGVEAKFQRIERVRTGKCFSLINATNRSLCACLGAASLFSLDFLHLPENAKLIDTAKFFYSSAHFFTVCPEAIKHLATKANELERPFLFNLSADYIPGKFKKELNEIMPFANGGKTGGRIVLITRGEKALIVAQNGTIKEFPVLFVDKIVDTNGAGDAFCGGFLAAFACDFSLEKCVKFALSAAATIVQNCGCTFPEEWVGECRERK
ncbi:hypothetical protein niasHS_005861 [Heterodera schachtii]|uniref:Adenosine kinase n=1 Tax=Heterodera schachtii TaxID=97005 RepID=A0ABD2JRV6_HETSC